jgi:ABC-2 type transport system permease protein
MSAPGSVAWLAAHEARLAWRDWRSMVTAGDKRRLSTALLILLLVGLSLHLPAWAMISGFADSGLGADKTVLVSVSVIVVLYASLLLSQAMESITRTLYARGDLDLVLSSPVSPRRLFSVRIAVNAGLIAIMGLVLTLPFVDILTVEGGPRWLAGFGVAIAVSATCTALAVAITIGLFRALGPRTTRLVAQIIAAVIGAGFAIGLQVFAILYYGTLARPTMLVADSLIAALPDEANPVWWPARAVLGDWAALAGVLIVAAALLFLVMAAFAPRFGEHSIAAIDLVSPARRRGRKHAFTTRTPVAALRHKEWLLLVRDPWLLSQTLTQLLYLIPPALLLMHNFGSSSGTLVVVVMVLVTIGGQLGGALAWLAISGEDAPDLVATAPVTPLAAIRAKVEAVLGAVGIVIAPLLAGFAILSPYHAAVALLGVTLAAISTVRIQLWFRAQAKRSHFRRRHTSSRIATFAEALTSFSWAAAAGLAAAHSWLAAVSAGIALIILLGTRAVSPRRALT